MVKRVLLICGIAALLTVPTAVARTSPALTSSCPCAVGSSATITGSGFNDNSSYVWTIVTTVPNQGPFPVTSSGGQMSFSTGPLPLAGTYEVRIYQTSGRSNPKEIASVYLVVS